MPIAGAVIAVQPADLVPARAFLAQFAEVEINGTDDRGNMVAVLETSTSETMERLIKTLSKNPLILHVGITYLNMEDVLPDIPGEGE
jgi:periplasmic nitrate reductase NapD